MTRLARQFLIDFDQSISQKIVGYSGWILCFRIVENMVVVVIFEECVLEEEILIVL